MVKKILNLQYWNSHNEVIYYGQNKTGWIKPRHTREESVSIFSTQPVLREMHLHKHGKALSTLKVTKLPLIIYSTSAEKTTWIFHPCIGWQKGKANSNRIRAGHTEIVFAKEIT